MLIGEEDDGSKVSIHRPSETDVMDEEVVSDELILITDRYKDYFCETFSDWELDLILPRLTDTNKTPGSLFLWDSWGFIRISQPWKD